MNKTACQRLLEGWPVYSAVAVFLFVFSELWIDKKIRDGIAGQTGQVVAITDLTTASAVIALSVSINEASINRVEGKVEEVERDTKAILLHLAGD